MNKTTPVGKAVRTAIQNFIAISPLLLGLLALPEVVQYIKENIAWLAPSLPVITAVVTYIQNYIEEK